MKLVLCLLTLGISLSMVSASVTAVEDESSHHYLRAGLEPEGLIESMEDEVSNQILCVDMRICVGSSFSIVLSSYILPVLTAFCSFGCA